MITALLSIPLIGALIACLIPDNRVRPLVLPFTAGLHLVVTLLLLASPPPPAMGGWIHLDPLGRPVLAGISILFFCCALYASGYLVYRQERSNRVLCPGLLVCLAAMSLVCIAQHFGLLWFALETTTLTMAPLIYFNRNARSIEATWKYMMICSVGIAFALLGLYFLAYSTVVAGIEPTLALQPLIANCRILSPQWLSSAFIFLFVGFGTKIGLAPLHSWKPDAYGEAPGLVGALLAGGLVNCGFLAILRIYQICAATPNAPLYSNLLVSIGLFSMLTAAVFMLKQADFKRLIAYSSVEHVGFLVIGLGMGKGALYGILLHLFNNGLTKGVLFLTAANIHRSYNSKRTDRVRGAIERLPWSGGLFMAALFAITGSPPFSIFVSKFIIISSIFNESSPAVGIAVVILFAVIFIGMCSVVLPILTGRPGADNQDSGYRDSPLTVAPSLIMVILAIVLGLWIPAPLHRMLVEAAALLGAQGGP